MAKVCPWFNAPEKSSLRRKIKLLRQRRAEP
jgi:hypothetical protein